MSEKWQIEQEGSRIAYTCENKRFKTDIRKGKNLESRLGIRGSVFDHPLVVSDRYTLWLEYVYDNKHPESECYWLMWYDKEGNPTISTSGVFYKDDLREIWNAFGDFLLRLNNGPE